MDELDTLALRLTGTQVAALETVEVGPGCRRTDLPGTELVRAWLVEMDPGSTWPTVDHHTDDEFVYIVDGVVLEDGRAYGPGSYFRLRAGSRHQPTTEVGVTMFGTNVERRWG